MSSRITYCLLTAIIGAILSACASTPATHFYVLDTTMSEPADPPAGTATKRLIGLGPVTIPALLERKQLVTRTGGNGVEIAELHQWAAPLQENITQTLTYNLSALLANDMIKAYPWSAYGEADYRLLVDIIRFDSTPGRSVNLEANWIILAEKNHKPVSHGQVKMNRDLADGSYPGAVRALSRILGEFSRQLSVELLKLH